MSERKRILFVDDDPKILHGLNRMLHPMCKAWEMYFIDNAMTALEYIHNMHFDVFVTDIRMPEIDGAELLTEVLTASPDTIRIVLSGQADTDTALRAARNAHQFLSKPCDSQTIRSTIERALKLHDYFDNEQLKKLVTHVNRIPILPHNYLAAIRELESENCSLTKIGEIIANDMGMSAKVMQLINSSFFCLPQHVSDPMQAVRMLGIDVVRSLLLMCEIFYPLEKLSLSDDTTYSLLSLQRHSLAVAAHAREIAKYEGLDSKSADLCFMAGLFHDIGKMILVTNMPDTYTETITLACAQRIQLEKAERIVFGTSHAEIGAYLLGLWGFEAPIIEACLYHHCPSNAHSDVQAIVTAVHVANYCDYRQTPSTSQISNMHIDTEFLTAIQKLDRLAIWSSLSHQFLS